MRVYCLKEFGGFILEDFDWWFLFVRDCDKWRKCRGIFVKIYEFIMVGIIIECEVGVFVLLIIEFILIKKVFFFFLNIIKKVFNFIGKVYFYYKSRCIVYNVFLSK